MTAPQQWGFYGGSVLMALFNGRSLLAQGFSPGGARVELDQKLRPENSATWPLGVSFCGFMTKQGM